MRNAASRQIVSILQRELGTICWLAPQLLLELLVEECIFIVSCNLGVLLRMSWHKGQQRRISHRYLSGQRLPSSGEEALFSFRIELKRVSLLLITVTGSLSGIQNPTTNGAKRKSGSSSWEYAPTSVAFHWLAKEISQLVVEDIFVLVMVHTTIPQVESVKGRLHQTFLCQPIRFLQRVLYLLASSKIFIGEIGLIRLNRKQVLNVDQCF